jgi:hypothetical protein
MATKKQPQQAEFTEDGFEIVQTSELKPFVDWSKTPIIEGKVGNFREIDGEYGMQDVCDVGDYSVGIVTTLKSLSKYEGDYLRIKYEGMKASKDGRQFKAFVILRRKTDLKK